MMAVPRAGDGLKSRFSHKAQIERIVSLLSLNPRKTLWRSFFGVPTTADTVCPTDIGESNQR